MSLMKITGLQQVSVPDQDHRQNADAPEMLIYHPAAAKFKYYAKQLLALTSLTDPAALEKIREAAEAIETADHENWTQGDAEIILSAVGVPPAPSHVVVTHVSGHAMVLIRAAPHGAKKARPLRYQTRSTRPAISLLSVLRAEKMAIPPGTCMEVPVKLVEDEQGLALALMLRKQRTRPIAEGDREPN